MTQEAKQKSNYEVSVDIRQTVVRKWSHFLNASVKKAANLLLHYNLSSDSFVFSVFGISSDG